MAYNEPSGSSVIFQTSFNNLSGMNDDYNSTQIRADATAPTSPSNCMYSRLAAGSLTGGIQLRVQPGSTWNDMYVRKWWRTNPGFQGRTVGNKMFFMRGNTTNGVFLFNNSSLVNGAGTMIFAHNTGRLDNSHIWSSDLGLTGFPNVGSGRLTVGTWYLLEAYIKCSTNATSRDGIVRWWVNGVLAGNYTNANYDGGLNNWTWSETWDGTPGFTNATVDWEHWVDELYISTGGTVTPSPSVPTISSFTPTSGAVGTPLTIVGTNFDPSPTGNAVTINNVACTVLASVPTQINTAVPNTATTGQVKVVTSAGTALSSTNFTVTTPSTGGGSGGGTGGGAGTTTYTFETDFSGTQGPRWYYLDGSGNQMSYSSGSQLWVGAQLYQGIWSGGFHPGSSVGAVLKYVVPGDGSVTITGQAQDLDTGGGNGVVFTLKKNGSTTLFTRTITNGLSSGGDYSVTETVTDGDYVTFEVTSSGENSYDSTRLNPVVVYTPQSQSEETITLALTSLSLQEGDVGAITLTITPTRSTESVITLASNSASAVIAGTVTIPANTGSTAVQVLAGTPGSATITATLGASSSTSTVISTAAPDPEDPIPVSPTLSAYTDFLLTYRWF